LFHPRGSENIDYEYHDYKCVNGADGLNLTYPTSSYCDNTYKSWSGLGKLANDQLSNFIGICHSQETMLKSSKRGLLIVSNWIQNRLACNVRIKNVPGQRRKGLSLSSRDTGPLPHRKTCKIALGIKVGGLSNVFDQYFLAYNANANIEECGHEIDGVLYAVQNIVRGPGGVGNVSAWTRTTV
jgi:hypothetical protein